MDTAPLSGSNGVEVPLSDWVLAIAERAARAVGDRMIENHVSACRVQQIAERAAITASATVSAAAAVALEKHDRNCPAKGMIVQIDVMKQRFAMLVGALLGSGVLGGTIGAVLTKALM